MTNQQHPITPPPELVEDWAYLFIGHTDTEVFSAVAQWGANQELEACCEWLQVRINEGWNPCHLEDLRNARRPKQPSLKEQALDELVAAERLYPADWSTIRRALETLPE
jgi:hypothetical protein